MDLLLHNLRTIGIGHCDGTVGEEAAEEIDRLRSENEKLRTALKRLIEVNETEAGDDFKAWASAMLDEHAAIGDGAVDDK